MLFSHLVIKTSLSFSPISIVKYSFFLCTSSLWIKVRKAKREFSKVPLPIFRSFEEALPIPPKRAAAMTTHFLKQVVKNIVNKELEWSRLSYDLGCKPSIPAHSFFRPKAKRSKWSDSTFLYLWANFFKWAIPGLFLFIFVFLIHSWQ